MKVSRTIAYAVQAALELAQAEPNCPIPSGELARRGKLPERFLLQILRSLVRHSIVCSVRGVDGGYYLARPPEKISLLDIIEAYENSLSPTVPDMPGISPQVRERFVALVVKTSAAAREELKKLTLADLARV
jgi:Rrf2 family protein